MQCPSIMSVKHPRYDDPTRRISIPCGKCAICLENRRADWTFRLQQEAELHDHTHFITLTYTDENLSYGSLLPTLVKSDFQNFMKRLRYYSPTKLRYYAVGEYGSQTHRPHYHVILFGLEDTSIISKAWTLGHIQIGSVTQASIHYVTKYHVNKNNYRKFGDFIEPPFCLMSTNPGIGSNYVEKMKSYHNLKNPYVRQGSIKQRMPRYYKDKLYTQAQKSVLSKKFEHERHKQEDDKQLEHYKSNPDKNYYEYQVEQFEYKNKTHKTKINANDKF